MLGRVSLVDRGVFAPDEVAYVEGGVGGASAADFSLFCGDTATRSRGRLSDIVDRTSGIDFASYSFSALRSRLFDIDVLQKKVRSCKI